jgi:hypothetical protein
MSTNLAECRRRLEHVDTLPLPAGAAVRRVHGLGPSHPGPDKAEHTTGSRMFYSA